MTINNGAIDFTTPVGNGTGTVDINRNIVGTVNGQYQNQIVPISVSGKITNVNAIQTVAFGSWSFSLNLGGGVTATGSGNWSASAPQTLSNFNGNYIGTYLDGDGGGGGVGRRAAAVCPHQSGGR